MQRIYNTRSPPKDGCCKTLKQSCFSGGICVPSKPAMFIFVCTVIIGTGYTAATASMIRGITRLLLHNGGVSGHFPTILAISSILTIFIVLYPLSGFLADVYFSRYKLIITGFLFLWLASVLATIGVVLNFLRLFDVAAGLSVLIGLFLALGLACYRSNIIQFGFDQLLDVPSRFLGMFVHWYLWSNCLGSLIVKVVNTVDTCFTIKTFTTTIDKMWNLLPLISLLLFTCILVAMFLLHKRHLFYTEGTQFNPYKLILKVFIFACKNSRPVRPPSAFVYCDNTVPSRVDFAKERFGGPFANSDVEDVKTFSRVLCILLTLAPIFILELPVSTSVFSLLTLHSGTEISSNVTCTVEWALLGSGSLSYITEVLFFPLYIWVVFSWLRNRVPRIFVRLGFSALLYILAVLSMLAVDLTGHIILHIEGKPNTMCMFVQSIPNRQVQLSDQTLNLHWAALIPPNLLIGIAPKLVMATALEFISAQSPHSMKGVVVGTLFAIKGLSRLLGAFLVVPFSLGFWKHGHLRDDPPVTSCGFGYFLITIFIALIGLVCFVVCARKYKYRVRGEVVFSQSVVEEVFDRRLQLEQEQRQFPLLADSSSSDEDTCSVPSQRATVDDQSWNTRSVSLYRSSYGSIKQCDD